MVLLVVVDASEEFDVEKGKVYTYGEDPLGLSYEITKINDDSIVIKTAESFHDVADNSNLDSTNKEFTISFNKEVVLQTPTMDTVVKYYLVLKK